MSRNFEWLDISWLGVRADISRLIAERINKTLKFEFGLRYTFDSFKEAQSTIQQAVFLYNNVRLHQHLGFFTPEFVHQAS
ncbi:integrase core domain-containing protein [Leptospira santarosai]|nr:integrase core domain-containing protein [Leptospira santarosai]MDI7185117.1 integrase core domain-containing protein [Leptospira santarosai]MDI7199159.1 integrase core domain-containing protein [Leptospira santarosai]MDI7205887.1 integrase core domain-containing protein [Leptospira santarosai]MDI7206024.1 integrase core domain-containing protein [Leptospira santarosai]MDI7209781.1 integrase core domain-containing protein [Leptospira santarosai]